MHQQQQPVISTFPNFELLFQEFSSIFLESSPDIANVTSSDNKSILTLPVQEVLTRSAKLNSLGTKTASGVKSLSSVSPVSKSMDRIILVPPDFFVLPHTETESDAGNFKSTWPWKKNYRFRSGGGVIWTHRSTYFTNFLIFNVGHFSTLRRTDNCFLKSVFS